MSLHLQRQIDRLKKMILSLGGMVEESLAQAIRAIEERDVKLAKQVIEQDDQIDVMEIDVEEECLHTLALHQPVAFDLRYVVAVLKINSDLERIGDLASSIAAQGVFLSELPKSAQPPFDLSEMADRVGTMVRNCLDAMVKIDVEAAHRIRQSDRGVDEIYRSVYGAVEKVSSADHAQIEPLIHYLNIAKCLERIGDHTVNIAEDIIYMAEGDIMRHGGRRAAGQQASA